MKQRNLAFGLSVLAIIASIVLVFTKGLNFGIDFSGGIVIEARAPQAVELSTIRSALSNQPELGQVELQHFGSNQDILIRLGATENDGEDGQALKVVEQVKTTLASALGEGIEYRKVDYVGPQVGSELIRAGILSVFFSFLAIMAYVWARFDWQFGIGAIAALLHDTALVFGFFVLTGLEFNLTSIAAILTIIGYSVNDSVVIYDRIRENLRKYKKMPLIELLDVSINETLSRTILTGGSTLAALVALIFYGGDVLLTFSLSVFFGVLVGTYSSVFISAPILILMNLRKDA